MLQPGPLPTLLRLMFGESAPAYLELYNERTLKWVKAFDGWLDERKAAGRSDLYSLSLLAWRRLLGLLVGLPPFAITTVEIERYRVWEAGQGMAAGTINNRVAMISAFYSWCSLHSVDPECGPSFNPAAGVSRLKEINYANAALLSPEEADALLEVLKADGCPLGRRDYALILASLRLGVPPKKLRELKWGQIKLEEDQAWVEWSPGKAAVQLPDEVWRAIRLYLEGSGRLGAERPGGMPAGAYIFAPLAERFGRRPGTLAEEWNEGRCLVPLRAWNTLKIYGRLAGIQEQKLTLYTLRNTAIALYLETPRTSIEMDEFLGNPGYRKVRVYRKKIKQLQQRQGSADFKARLPAAIRSRSPHDFSPGDGFKHGLYARHLPDDEVAAVMAEGITGMQEEVQGLETLMCGVMDWLEKTGDNTKAMMDLSDAHLINSPRLYKLLKFESEQVPGLSSAAALAEFDEILFDDDMYLVGSAEEIDELRAWAAKETRFDSIIKKSLALSIARERLVLRGLKRVALETDDPTHYANLLQKYGRGCMRLCRLLRVR